MNVLLLSLVLAADPPAWPPAPSEFDKLLGSDRLLNGAALLDQSGVDPYPVDSDEWLEEDPLLILDREMGSVVRDYGDGDLTQPHTVTQPRIIARLDRMIALLEEKKAGGGSANFSGNPAGDSTIRSGNEEAGELRTAGDKSGMQRLPEDQRERIKQAGADGFPPGFEDVLSDYYKRLAEAKE